MLLLVRAAGLAMGLTMLGGKAASAIEDMVAYAQTQHEKIWRSGCRHTLVICMEGSRRLILSLRLSRIRMLSCVVLVCTLSPWHTVGTGNKAIREATPRRCLWRQRWCPSCRWLWALASCCSSSQILSWCCSAFIRAYNPWDTALPWLRYRLLWYWQQEALGLHWALWRMILLIACARAHFIASAMVLVLTDWGDLPQGEGLSGTFLRQCYQWQARGCYRNKVWRHSGPGYNWRRWPQCDSIFSPAPGILTCWVGGGYAGVVSTGTGSHTSQAWAFQPSALIDLIRIWRCPVVQFKSNAKPSTYSYPALLRRRRRRTRRRLATAILSITSSRGGSRRKNKKEEEKMEGWWEERRRG